MSPSGNPDAAGKPTAASAEQDQRAHFDGIADAYTAHYADRHSLRYREKFINRFLFNGVRLEGANVLDAACGSGETTDYLLAQGATVTGLDVSSEMIDAFQTKFPGSTGVCASIFSTGIPADTFDCVSIVGGLHHFHPDIQKAIDEVHRILKPGGIFCFFEPPKGTLPDLVRGFWYKRDREMFAENEAPVDVDGLLQENSGRFRLISQRYGGNIAYLLVLNSLILRIPLGAKPIYSSAAMFLESIITPFQPKLLSCFVIGQWQKVGPG